MLDPADAQACGRCHDGTLSRPPKVTQAAPGATACTTCHTEPAGVLGCNTCHQVAGVGAHAAHIAASPVRSVGLPCSTCHPAPGPGVIGGSHGNGSVEVIFDPATVSPEASFDRTVGACAVACHDRSGARPRPLWRDKGPLGCNDCHSSPPSNHFPGACTTCHREANAIGTALTGGPLHMNGKVDVGDGTNACGACHGSGSDPWPTTAAHSAHKSPSLTSPVECASCHVVPTSIHSPGHLDGVVQVKLSGRAVDRGVSPSWNGQSCASVACHGAGLVNTPAVVPTWTDPSGAAAACGSCHGIPPEQHTASTSCNRSTCHGAEVSISPLGVPSISAAGKSLHINGAIDSY